MSQQKFIIQMVSTVPPGLPNIIVFRVFNWILYSQRGGKTVVYKDVHQSTYSFQSISSCLDVKAITRFFLYIIASKNLRSFSKQIVEKTISLTNQLKIRHSVYLTYLNHLNRISTKKKTKIDPKYSRFCRNLYANKERPLYQCSITLNLSRKDID